MKRLNILYVSNLYPPYVVGGAELVARDLAEYVAAHQHRVTVVTTMGPDDPRGPFHWEMINGVQVCRFFPSNLYWIYDKQEGLLRKGLWHLRDAWNVPVGRTVRQILLREQPEIVHTHNIDSFSPIVWNEARRLGIKVVHTSHDYHLLCPRATLLHRYGRICDNPPLVCRLYRAWYRNAAKNIDVFCGPSQFILDMHKRNGFAPGHFHLIRNGVPGAVTVRKKRFLDRPVRFLYLGRLSPEKGIHVLLEAMKHLHGQPMELHIGGRGPLEGNVQAAASLDSRIVYHGFVSGEVKRTRLEEADVMVLPSVWYDNAPLAVLEAFQYGIPMIVTNIGGLPELVEDGVSGLVVPPGDPIALGETMRRVALSPAFLRHLQEGARTASVEYTVEQMGTGYLSLYESLVSK